MNKAKSDYVSNLCKNALFPISAAAFYDLNDVPRNAVLLGAIAIIAIAAYFPDVYTGFRNASPKLRLVSILSSIGTSIACAHMSITTNINYFDWAFFLDSTTNTTLYYIYKIIMMVLAVFFIIVPMEWFYSHAYEFAREYCKKLERSDKLCLLILFVLFSAYIIFSYLTSYAFYGGEIPYDIIYTSDSPDIMNRCAYLWLGHPENDIRQPLFAVFSAPFLGIPYLISVPFMRIGSVMPIVFSCVQTAMMLLAFHMISEMLGLNAFMRVVLMVTCSCAYPTLLFGVMMEQYIVCFFWLIVFIYNVCQMNERSITAYSGAVGTLLTSGVLFPLLSEKRLIHDFKGWVKDIFTSAVKVLFLFLMFGKIHYILNFYTYVKRLSSYTGKEVTFTDKLYRYSFFIRSCILTPPASVSDSLGFISWQVDTPVSFSVAGIIILAAAAVGFAVSRKNKLSQISFFWIIFSFVLLVLIGWGSSENGMILYSLYFGWAFYVLIFRLAVFVGDKLKISAVLPYIFLVSAAAVLGLNYIGIKNLLDFAVTYYPAFG